MRPPGLETLYLIVTDHCNLRCRYCIINSSMPVGYKNSHMGFAVAKEAIDMFFYNLSRNPPEYSRFMKTIFFDGGEPFLNFTLIKQAVEYIETAHSDAVAAMGSKLRLSIVTNGTAITEEAAIFVGSRSNIDIAVSIDGPKTVHDKQRIDAGGGGSFDRAINGLTMLKAAGKAAVSVSCTIGDDNI